MLDELTGSKLLSDDRYAEARAHALARKFGAARIEHELKARAVGEETVARVTEETRATELARAREAWRKRFGVQPANRSERAKQIRFLQGRGFAFEVIRRVVKGADENE